MNRGPSVRLSDEPLLAAVGTASDRLIADLTAAGPDAPVPTCPPWTAGDLVGHVGGVHRFARTVVAQARTTMASDEEVAALFAAPPDPGPWFRAGAEQLIAALRAAPEDLVAIRFLASDDPPRRYWIRRQAHETTVHGIDMLAARLGRLPTTEEAELSTALALDGIDEVLRSFFTRPVSVLRRDEPYRVVVRPTDADATWTVSVSAGVPQISARAVRDDGIDAELTGPAAALYLRLWGRGTEGELDGPAEVRSHWGEHLRL